MKLWWAILNHVVRFRVITIHLIYLSNKPMITYDKQAIIQGLRWEFALGPSNAMHWQKQGLVIQWQAGGRMPRTALVLVTKMVNQMVIHQIDGTPQDVLKRRWGVVAVTSQLEPLTLDP